jgi:hypothetical protein
MANTFELIASSTVGSGGAATITFSSIPSTFTDLCVKLSLRNDNANTIPRSVFIGFNGTSTNESGRYLLGYNTSAQSGTLASDMYIVYGLQEAGTTASTFASSELYIPNYASSNYKSSSADGVIEGNTSVAQLAFTANLWSNTAAITSITFTPEVGNFVQYSTAYLYGVKNA